MSSLEPGNAHYSPSSSSDLDPATYHPSTVSQAASSVPTLPAYTYSQSLIKRPKVSTSFEKNTSTVRLNGSARAGSPDPHEFYRRDKDQYRASLQGASGRSDIKVQPREGGMAATGQRASPIATRNGNSKPPPLTSRIHSRYNNSPTSERSPLSAAKSSPTLSNNARNRQTSLRDLVDRFNQQPNETLPLPGRSGSRSPSVNSNHGSSTPTSRIQPRTSSLSSRTSDGSARKTPTPTSNPKPYLRSRKTNEDLHASPKSKRTPRTQRTGIPDFRPSVSDIPPRKPLFGEILARSPGHTNPGFGIPVNRRRRGSEGSMHSPNPMFPPEQGRPILEATPSSPAAWYLGATPTLEEIKTEKHIPELPSNLHRRTRSDFSGAPSRPPASKMYGSDRSPSRITPSPPSSTTNSSKRNSQSRIPISTRRMSTASDSGNSTHSTRTTSALGRAHMKALNASAATAPKRIPNIRPPPLHSRSSTPQKSPRRGDFGSGIAHPATSPRLAAYISAPLPKKSPPLRSSRPRQPVTNASTSASRARAVERLASHHENGVSRIPRESRPRKPPELAGVDFAARRQKIQLAVTKSVKEKERKDERKRASMAMAANPPIHSTSESPIYQDHITPQRHNDTASNTVSTEDSGGKDARDGIEDTRDGPQLERELAINTGHIQERSVLDLSMEDSPTLGTYDRFPTQSNHLHDSGETTPSDIEPSSAITAGTSDSVDTFFDDEPQDDPQDSARQSLQSHENPNLLDHILSTRDSSPSPESFRPPMISEETASERDDQESIQIMLGETPVTEKLLFQDKDYEEKVREAQPSNGHDNRWSMSSWTSSTKSRDDREAPMERIDEYSPTYTEQPAHLSISTTSSQQTPQPWSPQSFSSPRTARTTMDSDAYSTINRVLDHYHDPSVSNGLSPEVIQQHINIESPDLARQGGWDPKKVTALYLQELAKGRYGQSPAGLDPLKFQRHARSSSTKVPEIPEKEVRDDHNGKMIPSIEQQQEDPTPPGTSLTVDEGDFVPARASLTGPGDWDMSPSLGGLHLQAEAGDSPADDKPMGALGDWGIASDNVAEMPGRERSEAGQHMPDSHPQLPPIDIGGKGLAINLTPPQSTDLLATAATPPIPLHSPPPPPAEPATPAAAKSIVPQMPTASSYDSTREPRSKTPSVPKSASSSLSMSQDRQSVERPSMSTEATSKTSSPSPDQKRLTRRRHIVKELVDTEHSFGQDMKVVEDIYKGTANIIVISAEDVKTLFGNSDQIVAFSSTFLDALKRGSKSVYTLAKSKRWRSDRASNATSYSGTADDQSSIDGAELSDEEKDRRTFVGEAFGRHMAQMERVYTDYLKNHDAANQKLQTLQKSPKVQIWLKECRAYAHDLTSAWDLDSLLVKPVQRILKYPLLLDQLLEVTPENHPDFSALDVAAREMKGMAKRIDESKKRADLMEQVTNTRKRKESDVRIGLSKAFGRRTEKIKQQVGLTGIPEDKAYTAVSEKFGSHFFQLQVVMRDVQMYTSDIQTFVGQFCDFASAMEAHIDVGQTNYPELESKWRKFRMSTREMSMTALTDHIAAVRKNVIDPMTTLLQLHDGPQKLMAKRNKRINDFARFKGLKDRGDKPDKKTVEQGEQFQAINDTLKEELPRLFSLTGKLVESCLNNFVQLQLQWQIIWRRKLSQAIDDMKPPVKAQEIVDAFTGDFAFIEAQVLSLGLCNGSMLNDVANQIGFLSPVTTLDGVDANTPRQASQASSLDLSKRRTLSISSDKSPVLPQPDFGGRSSGSFLPMNDGMQLAPAGNYVTGGRMRASSTLSGHSPRTPEIPGSYHSSFSNSTTPVNTLPGRPSTATPRTYTEPIPYQNAETPSGNRKSQDSSHISGYPGTTYPPSGGSSQYREDSSRYSGFFSSAMPMSDSPPSQSPVPSQGQHFNVIFLAASVYEFNIDKARKEAGYPYLTYVAGEIFDVIGEKGELWLAKNQDDRDNLVGWIWNKHFVKLAQ